MKRIINKEVNESFIGDIQDNDFVGALFENREKVLVLEKDGEFYGQPKDCDSFNGYWTTNSKKEYLEEVEKIGGVGYKFETFGEACEWLLNKK